MGFLASVLSSTKAAMVRAEAMVLSEQAVPTLQREELEAGGGPSFPALAGTKSPPALSEHDPC